MPGEQNGDNAVERAGLEFWMARVLKECERATVDFAPEPIHDLRVALRRCRSIAEGFRGFDPCRDWGEMRKESARIFKKLGELRDIQVMKEWLNLPAAPQDEVSAYLLNYLAARELKLREVAARALDSFNRKKWSTWMLSLSKRVDCVPLNGAAFRHLALEHWHNAYGLHRQALRNRSHIGFHRLRIGMKKLRYLVENFLPGLHEEWGEDLRVIQNLLGEMHDLDVLLYKANEIGALHDKELRDQWRSWIAGEYRLRQDEYRRRMTGTASLWRIWRKRLPQGDQLRADCIERLKTWAYFRDPDSERTERVVRLALQIYEGLTSQDYFRSEEVDRLRNILHVAALSHAIGAEGPGRKRHKRSYRLLCKLQLPIGLELTDFRMAALAVRYHRGALPAPDHKPAQELMEEDAKRTILLAAILRLAVAFSISPQIEICGLEINDSGQQLLIRAKGYDEYSSLAQKLARDRHLLEIASGLPLIIRS